MAKFIGYNRASHVLTVHVRGVTHSYRVPRAIMSAAPATARAFGAFFRKHIAGGFYRLS